VDHDLPHSGEKLKMIFDRKAGLAMICILAVLQGILRFAIAFSILSGNGPELENPISDELSLAINGIFIVLGGAGILTAVGLWQMKAWGYVSTLVLSAGTIIFDLLAGALIQSSAYMGMILPIVFIVYLLLNKDDFQGASN